MGSSEVIFGTFKLLFCKHKMGLELDVICPDMDELCQVEVTPLPVWDIPFPVWYIPYPVHYIQRPI